MAIKKKITYEIAIDTLLELEAIAEYLERKAGQFKTECRQKRQKLEGVSTPSSARKGLSEVQLAAIVAKRNKRFLRSPTVIK